MVKYMDLTYITHPYDPSGDVELLLSVRRRLEGRLSN